MVAVYHSFAVFRIDGAERLWTMPLFAVETESAFIGRIVTVLGNGAIAVTIFFILSGVVLGLSLDQAKGRFSRTYGAFIVKRIFRIYPAHILVTAVVVLALALGMQLPESQATTNWFGKWYDREVDFRLIATNALLLNTYLNPVTWTLLTEMVVALFFPLLFLASRRSSRIVNIAIFCSLAALPFLKPGSVILPQLCKFYIGLLIPLYGRVILSGHDGRVAGGAIYWFVAIGAMVTERALGTGVTAGLLEVLGAAMIIAGLLFAPMPRYWDHHLLRALGRHSYSFYLWQFPTMYFLVRLWTSNVADRVTMAHPLLLSALLCLSSVVVANLLGFLSYRFIEAPFIRHGKHVSKYYFGG